MPSKYRAHRVTNELGTFDSAKEERRYRALLEKLASGEISDLKRQIPYELIPSNPLPHPVKKGKRTQKTELAVKYYADFVYTENGETVVEDVKGFRTKEYIIKKKLMLWRYGIQIKEV